MHRVAGAFFGVAFSPDGSTLYASGGDQDVVYRYDWRGGRATLRDSLVLALKPADKDGTRYPAGLATSSDGNWLYVAENLADSLAVVDVRSGAVVRRLPAGRYPYAVVVSDDGRVFVSAWGGDEVTVYRPGNAGLVIERSITVARHPSALLLNATGTRLFATSGSTDRVSVVDARTCPISSTATPARAAP